MKLLPSLIILTLILHIQYIVTVSGNSSSNSETIAIQNNNNEVSFILTSQPNTFHEITNQTKGNHVFVLYYTKWSMTRQISNVYLELYDLYHHHRDFTTNFLAYNCEIYQAFCEKQNIKQLPSFKYYFNNTIDHYQDDDDNDDNVMMAGDIIPNGKRRMNLQSMKSYVLKSVPSLLRKKTTHESDYCIGFKRTDKHYKKRFSAKDVNCLDVVRNGVYGYCECLVNTISIDNNEEEDTNNVNDENDIGTKHIHLNISFYHQPFRCVDKCMAYYNVSF